MVNILTYVAFWFPMLILAIINGGMRDKVLVQHLGELHARQFSTISLIGLFGLYFYFVFKFFPVDSVGQAIQIGILWLFMTLAFEFGFGRYRRKPWKELFSDYDLTKGRLWILVPIWVAIAPYLYFLFFR